MAATDWWAQRPHVEWVQHLLRSFYRWTGRRLIEPGHRLDEHAQAEALFYAPFVVVSHGGDEDPILNYGNRAALNLWEMTWEELRRMPSRLTAEPVNRDERACMLEHARARGYIAEYHGVRISKTGRRFRVDRATIWNVLNAEGEAVGQAATFSHWTPLD